MVYFRCWDRGIHHHRSNRLFNLLSTRKGIASTNNLLSTLTPPTPNACPSPTACFLRCQPLTKTRHVPRKPALPNISLKNTVHLEQGGGLDKGSKCRKITKSGSRASAISEFQPKTLKEKGEIHSGRVFAGGNKETDS